MFICFVIYFVFFFKKYRCSIGKGYNEKTEKQMIDDRLSISGKYISKFKRLVFPTAKIELNATVRVHV